MQRCEAVVFPLMSAGGGPDFPTTQCLATDLILGEWVDDEPRGDSGYLVRGVGPCGPSSWGVATLDAAGGAPTCP